MPRLTFWGHSDDRIYAHGEMIGAGEFVAANRELAGEFQVAAPDGSALRAMAIYDTRGTWSFAAALIDDGAVLPPWSIRVLSPEQHGKNEYSTMLVIEVPDGSTLKRLDTP